MLKEKLKMMNGVLENGNYQLGQFAFVEQSGTIKEQCFRWVDPLESTALFL